MAAMTVSEWFTRVHVPFLALETDVADGLTTKVACGVILVKTAPECEVPGSAAVAVGACVFVFA